jgi:hypothetical protein
MLVKKFLHSIDRNALRKGSSHKDRVVVYYGCDTYKRTVEHVHTLVMAIKEDFPDIPIAEMNVYEITKAQSDQHVGHTMVSFYANAQIVKNNLDSFSVL